MAFRGLVANFTMLFETEAKAIRLIKNRTLKRAKKQYSVLQHPNLHSHHALAYGMRIYFLKPVLS